MTQHKRSLSIGALGALLLCAAIGARAQDSAGNSAGAAIGPPQLKDFQLQPRDRPAAQPARPAPSPVELAPPSPVTGQPPAPAQARPAPARTVTEAPRQAPAAPPQPAPTATERAPAPSLPVQPAPSLPVAAAPPQPVPEPAPAATPEQPGGGFPWLYAIPAAALALLGFVIVRRRRRGEADEPEEAEAPAAAPAPRPAPVPRPWLELALKAERASATLTETVVMFELEIANTGKAPARNLRIDVKMLNAGREQDKEIGAFFRTAGRESTKCSLPGIDADTIGVIRGQVTMPREEMRAVQLDDKLLFIPVIAVNALYDWDDGRTGQTSKSYVVGRELEQPSDKMGAFRVDLGPRIWRAVGQRQHKLARRV